MEFVDDGVGELFYVSGKGELARLVASVRREPARGQADQAQRGRRQGAARVHERAHGGRARMVVGVQQSACWLACQESACGERMLRAHGECMACQESAWRLESAC